MPRRGTARRLDGRCEGAHKRFGERTHGASSSCAHRQARWKAKQSSRHVASVASAGSQFGDDAAPRGGARVGGGGCVVRAACGQFRRRPVGKATPALLLGGSPFFPLLLLLHRRFVTTRRAHSGGGGIRAPEEGGGRSACGGSEVRFCLSACAAPAAQPLLLCLVLPFLAGRENSPIIFCSRSAPSWLASAVSASGPSFRARVVTKG